MDLRTVRHDEIRGLLVRHAWRPILWGELTGFAASDLLSIFHLGRHTGLLIVQSPDGERALGFRAGECVLGRSTCDERGVRDVCFGVLKDQAGSFVFLRGPLYALPADEGCDVQELLLDCMRRIDEESFAQGREAA